MNENALLDLLNEKFKDPLTASHMREMFIELKQSIEKSIRKRQNAEYQDVQLGNQPYVVDYKERLHIFAFNPTNNDITLTSSDGATVLLPKQTWSNIGFRDTTRLSGASGQIIIKCTDEVVP